MPIIVSNKRNWFGNSPIEVGSLPVSPTWRFSASTLDLNDNDQVNSWESTNNIVTSNRYTGSPTYTSSSGINNQPAVSFDGDGYFEIGVGLTIGTVIAVVRYNEPSFNTYTGLFTGNAQDNNNILVISDSDRNSWMNISSSYYNYNVDWWLDGNSIPFGDPIPEFNSPHIHIFNFLDTPTLPGFIMGNDRHVTVSERGWIGDISELIVYDQIITDQERDDVENYLSNVYAI